MSSPGRSPGLPGVRSPGVLPSHLPRWPLAFSFLSEAVQLFEQGQLGFQQLQAAASVLRTGSVGEDFLAALTEPSVYEGLERFVMTQLTPQTQYRVLTTTLPVVIRSAAEIHRHWEEPQIVGETHDNATRWSLPVPLFRSLLACGILGLLPEACLESLPLYTMFGTERLVGDLARPEDYDRLRAILQYFDCVGETRPSDANIHFITQHFLNYEEIAASDWLQCDTPLCDLSPVHVHPKNVSPEDLLLCVSDKATQAGCSLEQRAGRVVLTAVMDDHLQDNPAVNTFQVGRDSSPDTFICTVPAAIPQFPASISELERCQLFILQQLEELSSAYTHQGDEYSHQAAGISVREAGTGVPGVRQRRPGPRSQEPREGRAESKLQVLADVPATSRLLAFSQQLSENILNEAVQISTNRSDELPWQHGYHGDQAQALGNHQSGGQTDRRHGNNFVNIPVQVEVDMDVEANQRRAAAKPKSTSAPVPPPLAFKKILLVEEEEDTGILDGAAQRFMPHSVQGMCIEEESSHEPSPSDSVSSSVDVDPAGASQPAAAPSQVESFARSFAEGIMGGLDLGAASREAAVDLGRRDSSSRDSLLSGVLSGTGLPKQCITQHSSCQESVQQIMSPEEFRSSVETMVDEMLHQAFHTSYCDLESRIKSEPVDADKDIQVAASSAIEEYVSGLVDDSFESAMYKIREYFTEISRSNGCHSVRVMGGFYLSDAALDREWNAQLTAFVDDFVMNVMEEALYISKTQEPRRKERKLTHHRTDSGHSDSHRSCDLFDVSKTSDSARACDFARVDSPRTCDSIDPRRAARQQYLRATDHSSGSSRRGSYEDEHGSRRRSSAGFRDATLSEFEDELVNSDISTPSFQTMFHTERRASEPASQHRARHRRPEGKKRARSVDSSTSRRVILQWLSSSSSSNGSGGRKRTSSSHLDWFAQDLLVEAFNDAFVTMFGRNYECLREHEPETVIENYAEEMSQSILHHTYSNIRVASPCLRSSCERSESVPEESDTEYHDALDVPLSRLEAVADTFSARVIREALDIVRRDLHRYTQASCKCLVGDDQVRVMLRWAAATRCGARGVIYCTLSSVNLQQLSTVATLLRKQRYSVADVLHLLFSYLEERTEGATEETLFSYIFSHVEGAS